MRTLCKCSWALCVHELHVGSYVMLMTYSWTAREPHFARHIWCTVHASTRMYVCTFVRVCTSLTNRLWAMSLEKVKVQMCLQMLCELPLWTLCSCVHKSFTMLVSWTTPEALQLICDLFLNKYHTGIFASDLGPNWASFSDKRMEHKVNTEIPNSIPIKYNICDLILENRPSAAKYC